jgi:Cdc6-like AAA superfamily ATPase
MGDDGSEVRMKLREVFMPSQPVSSPDVFAGRLPLLAQMIEAIEDQRSHVILHGERGIGKTSLLRVFAQIAGDAGYLVAHESCSATSRFSTLFRDIAQQIPLLYYGSLTPTESQDHQGATLADALPKGAAGPSAISRALATVIGTRVIVVLDEFDRAENETFQRDVAELIKNLSDASARVQLVIAGVAHNLQNLLDYSPSIRRNVVAIPVTPLEDEEVEQLIGLGEQHAGLQFDPAAKLKIVQLCHGRPYLTRLICHHASLNVLSSGGEIVRVTDVSTALSRAVTEMEERFSDETRAAVREFLSSHRREAISAARLSLSGMEQFTAEDVAEESSLPQCELSALFERYSVSGLMTKSEARMPHYRFTEEGLASYILLRVNSHAQGA